MNLTLPPAPNVYNVQDQVQLRLALSNALRGLDLPETVTMPEIAADQNDYDTGVKGTRLRISSDAARNITGFANGRADREFYLVNVGSFDITLQNQNAGSDELNRIITGSGADIVLAADDIAHVWYDGITGRWRVWSHY